jgi:IS5 family transposase
MNRNYLVRSSGDAINAVLAAVGYNHRLLLRWLALLWPKILASLFEPPTLGYRTLTA